MIDKVPLSPMHIVFFSMLTFLVFLRKINAGKYLAEIKEAKFFCQKTSVRASYQLNDHLCKGYPT